MRLTDRLLSESFFVCNDLTLNSNFHTSTVESLNDMDHSKVTAQGN